MERKSKSTKSENQKKINSQKIDILKNRKRKFINLLADVIITRDDYHESVEATNMEL